MDFGDDFVKSIDIKLEQLGYSWNDLEKVAIKTGKDSVTLASANEARKLLEEDNKPFYAYLPDYVIIGQTDFRVLSVHAIPRNPTKDVIPDVIY